MTTCAIDSCSKAIKSRGWCAEHYNRWYRHGDPEGMPEPRKPGSRSIDPSERIWSKVDFSDPNGCWPWTGSKRHAYGEIYVNGKKEYAHRVMHEMLRGPLAEGLVVCHTCDNPICVRPDHLFASTQKGNMRDMARKGRWGNKTRINNEDQDIVRNEDLPCSECGGPVLAKGLCRLHYQQVWKASQIQN